MYEEKKRRRRKEVGGVDGSRYTSERKGNGGEEGDETRPDGIDSDGWAPFRHSAYSATFYLIPAAGFSLFCCLSALMFHPISFQCPTGQSQCKFGPVPQFLTKKP